MQNKFYTFLLFFFCLQFAQAGNPDRQGETGATQLLLNPWAKSTGLHNMYTSGVSGVEAMRLNVAGLVRITNKTQLVVAHTRYFEGADLGINALGFSQKVGEHGAFGVSLMAMDMGDNLITTTNQPEGTGATFSPSFFNIGLSYAHEFENKVSVGVTVRMVSERIADVSASGVGIDAGVQYVTGENDNFKFGISLKNVGSPLKFSGEGLSQSLPNPDNVNNQYNATFNVRANKAELPSVLNIGASYDFILDAKNRVTVIGNFTSNTFSEDQVGAAFEYTFNEMFTLRGGYKYELVSSDETEQSIDSGIAAGVSFQVPLNKTKGTSFGLDYGYNHTNILDGTHSISVRFNL